MAQIAVSITKLQQLVQTSANDIGQTTSTGEHLADQVRTLDSVVENLTAMVGTK